MRRARAAADCSGAHSVTQALTYVEIDVPVCSLDYGVTPCAASIPETGERKCFNTRKTCQDRPNYAEQLVTLRYSVPTAYLPPEIDSIPSIRDVNFSPVTISLGENIGQRATVTVKLGDHPHSDAGEGYDRYHAERPYSPWDQGSYWGKFRARQPFLRGRAVRLISGQVGDALADMETRHFVIESTSGPGIDGEFKIVGKDILKLAGGDRAQAPKLSNGFLGSGISASATSATLSPSGIGDAEYPASGRVAIGGQEICSFTRSGDTLTLTRGQLNTTAQAHSAQDRVQVVLAYEAQDAADIISDLLQAYANVGASYVPLTTWQAETAQFLDVVYTAYITEPTPVADLVSELVTQAALAIWWDDVARKLRLQVLRSVDVLAAVYDRDDVIGGSLKITEQPNRRISRVQLYFAQLNPLRPLSDLDNFRSSVEVVETDAEADYGSVVIRQVLSRWIPALGRTVAQKAANKLLARYRDPPRRFVFDVLRYTGAPLPVLGAGYRLEARPLQDATGAVASVPIQVTRLTPDAAMIRVEAEEMLFTEQQDAVVDRTIIIDFDTLNINLRTAHDILFPAPESGDEILCRINAGVVVGSASSGLAAFDVGIWPAGVQIILELYGRIQGRGGDGGNGGAGPGATNGGAGSHGGIALYTRTDITVRYFSAAAVWGGGGGGGGGSGVFPPRVPSHWGGGGGGGGAGTNPGALGVGAYNQNAPITPGSNGTPTAGGSGDVYQYYSSGGDGGDPGLPGQAGHTSLYSVGGAGGNAGAAIDGDSYVTIESGTADIRGPTVN